MANKITPIGPFRWRAARLAVGLSIAALITVLIAALIINLATSTGAKATGPATVPPIAHLLRMTTIQAALSTLLSLATGMALAWALDRLDFPGRALLISLLSAALVLPPLVVAAGLLSVWGRAGWINRLIEAATGWGFGSIIFGLGGIIAAHVIFNGAFAARVLLTRIEAVPATRLRLGQGLGLSPFTRFRVIDWAAMAPSLSGLAATIFLMCFTSFAIVLVLGGGPANQTFEVAIYSAVRLDFDLAGAVRLALVQLFIAAAIIIPAASFSPAEAIAGATLPNRWRDAGPVRALQIAILVTGGLGFAFPLIGVAVDGVIGLPHLLGEFAFWRSAVTSLVVGTASALLTLLAALVLSMARATTSNRALRVLVNLPVFAYLAVPAVVLSLGFFLIARNAGVASGHVAPLVLVISNALLALPFAVATLGPPMEAINRRYGKLTRALGLSGFRHWRDVEFPLIRREIGVAVAIGFCFSLGDLGVISLFGTQDFSTLPWLMLRALGAYRSTDAAAIAFVLLVISVGAFTLIPRLTEGRRRAQS